MRSKRIKPSELYKRFELFHFLGTINAAFNELLRSLNSCAGFGLPVCAVAVPGAAPRGRAHGGRLAGHAHGVSLAQVLHPARVRAHLQSTVLGKRFRPELHTVSAQEEKHQIMRDQA